MRRGTLTDGPGKRDTDLPIPKRCKRGCRVNGRSPKAPERGSPFGGKLAVTFQQPSLMAKCLRQLRFERARKSAEKVWRQGIWSGRRNSNPRPNLGKVSRQCATPANAPFLNAPSACLRVLFAGFRGQWHRKRPFRFTQPSHGLRWTGRRIVCGFRGLTDGGIAHTGGAMTGEMSRKTFACPPMRFLNGGAWNMASIPAVPAMRRCSERVGAFPKALVLRDPGIRIRFRGKTGGRLWQGTRPGHLHGETVIVSLDHAISRISHDYLSPVGNWDRGASAAQCAFRVHTRSSQLRSKSTSPARTVPTMSA